uniref:UPAR/Ly6 domain-containing protein n=1 Tax=Pseudonaja textilis TaxID=8673 RepID=A0A670Z838_PSETE
MALILAWTLLFPIFSFLGCFSLCSASAEDNAFHFDTEESSAHGSQDNSLLRGQQQAVAFASWSHFAEKCQEGFYRTISGNCKPCHCNNNAYKCLDGSGVCVVGNLSCFTMSTNAFAFISGGSNDSCQVFSDFVSLLF